MAIKSICTSTLILCSLTLTGCASLLAPKPYDDSHSRAYNIAREGKLFGVRDHDKPAGNGPDLSNTVDIASNTALLTSSAGLGLGLASGFGLGLAANLLAPPPKDPDERNSLIGWMPKSKAGSVEEARFRMIEIIQASVEKTLKMHKSKFDVVYNEDGHIFYHFYNTMVRTLSCSDSPITT